MPRCSSTERKKEKDNRRMLSSSAFPMPPGSLSDEVHFYSFYSHLYGRSYGRLNSV